MNRKTRKLQFKSFTQVYFALGILLLSALTNSYAQEKKTTQFYSISDLEVLQQANAYREFFKHAHDILPTKRTPYWLNMVSNMAQGFIDLSIKQDNFDAETFKLIEGLSRWPELRGDEFFQIKRNRFSLSYFNSCLSTSKTSLCKKRILSFWKSAKRDAETSYRLLQFFAGFFPRDNQWPFLKVILNGQDGQFYCDKPLVLSASLKHIEKQHLYTESVSKQKAFLARLASNSCWQKMANHTKLYLRDTPTSEARSVFVAFDSTNMLDETDTDTWLVRYFLSAPKPGVLLNRAWKVVEKLAHNYAKRSKVLKSLENLDPLPGELFANLKRKKNKVLFNHLTLNFPEYIQTYSKTCLTYREGKKIFPRGNPTLECTKLMEFDKDQKRKSVSQELHMRYSGTLKN